MISRDLITIVCILVCLIPNLLMAAEPASASREIECVILLHGMGRSPSSMREIETHLLGKGYKTVNLVYPSTSESIERIAEVYIPNAIAKCQLSPVDKIHFVAHSLGGIIVRQYLQTNSLPEGSRVVMLAPPNQGSEVVDYVKEFFAYKWLYGPPGQELGTNPESTPNRLKPIDIEVGIITGDRSFNPIFSALIPGPDDGRVSVERAKLQEMTDFLLISSPHTSIVTNPAVLKQVAYFLDHGKFDHSQEDQRLDRKK
ncbi:MAG: alpha/beta hydrolase [Desulfobacterales bacterium]|nr:MAG: alpha/beta hydrolase [Desulfobacterales bacterium]